jgi:pimeloyl-ACP methyl ester carboxylesterase
MLSSILTTNSITTSSTTINKFTSPLTIVSIATLISTTFYLRTRKHSFITSNKQNDDNQQQPIFTLANVLMKTYPNLGKVFAGQGNRTVGYVSGGGCELGEALATLQRIDVKFNKISSFQERKNIWYEEWNTIGQYVWECGKKSELEGRLVSARQAYLRASEYFRQCAFFLRDNPIKDSRCREAYYHSYATFELAGKAKVNNDWTLKSLPLQMDGKKLPCYLISPASSTSTGDQPSRVVIIPGGYDSTVSEMFVGTGICGLRRGYHVLIFDAPGQGITITESQFMSPDFDKILPSVLDLLKNFDQVYIIGRSFGGYLVPRGLITTHQRVTAAAVDPGQINLMAGANKMFPPEIIQAVMNDDVGKIESWIRSLVDVNDELHFHWHSRRVTHGKTLLGELFLDLKRYKSDVSNVTTPVLCIDNPFDTRSTRGDVIFDALKSSQMKKLVTFNELDGAGDHCEVAAQASFERIVFDYFDEIGMKVGINNRVR